MQKLTIKGGDKYGRLTIMEETDKKGNRRYFKCKCSCGNIKIIQMSHLRGGKTISCGCYAKEQQSKQGKKSIIYMIATLKTHGMSYTRFYRTYNNIKNRCYNKKYKEFKYRGGRGIKVEWLTFEDFYKDMYKSYLEHEKKYGTKNTTIDREDNNGNYSEKNCRWATYETQSNNKRCKNGKSIK